VDLAGQPVAPGAHARAFWSQSRGLIFTASRLPRLPPGRTYQLWIISGETPVGAGLLRPSRDGSVQASFSPPAGVVRAVAFAVTSEPDGGVVLPTGDKYLVGLVN
jgi:anti-sigma-K factor RskA